MSEAMGREAILPLFAGLWAGLIVLSLVFRQDDPAAGSDT